MNINENFMNYPSSSYYSKQCQGGPLIIKYENDVVYDHFLGVKYRNSGPSTVVCEVISNGAIYLC